MFGIDMNKILLILSYFLLFSCVGKVEDANSELTKGINDGETVINYTGIQDAFPIAHDKVEIYFPPSNLDPLKVTYIINYDGAIAPITVPGRTLVPDYRGFLRYTVTGLNINEQYVFNVQAKDDKGQQSVNDAFKSVTTFSNQTSNFTGIGSIKNLSGGASKNSLLIEWPAAERTGGYIPEDSDVSKYEVVLINSDTATPVAFDDTSFTAPTRIVNYVDGKKISQQVNGLLPGTTYYVRVRGIHHGFSKYSSDPSYFYEKNNSYLSATTLSDSVGDIQVDLDSFEVTTPSNSTGKTSLDLSWATGIGAIDHYRIYYKENGTGEAWSTYKNSRDDICNGQETTDPAYFCKQVTYEDSKSKLVELEPYTSYEVYLIMCLDSLCSPGKSIIYNSPNVYRTSPPLVSFSGITEVNNPRYHWALNEIYLSYEPVDLASGVIDGMLIEVKGRSSGEPYIDTFINFPDGNNPTSLNPSTLDFTNGTEVSIRGIDINSTEEYCFALLPFVYVGDVVTPNRDSEVVSCIVPQVMTPTYEDFTGISSLYFDSSNNSAAISWTPPEEGVYDRYVVFMKTTAGTFSFSDAVNGDNDYLRFEAEENALGITIPFIPAGTYYFGALTYLYQEDKYSEFNNSIQTLVVE